MTFEEKIQDELVRRRKLLLKTYLLRDDGEEKLRYVLYYIMERLGQSELIGPIHAAVRELVQNAAKANLKRVLFDELGLNPLVEEDYEEGIREFRKYLVKKQLTKYRPRVLERGLYFTIAIEYTENVFVISVRNRFPLLPVEEVRIRDKFTHAQSLDNLYDFYMKFGDMTEGAGMGIAMVEILMGQGGVDRHNFTIFTDPLTKHVTARILIPLNDSYVSTRQQFQAEMERRGCAAEELRKLVHSGEFKLKLFY